MTVSQTTIAAFEPIFVRVVLRNDADSGEISGGAPPTSIGIYVHSSGSAVLVPFKSRNREFETIVERPLIVPPGESRIISYAILFQPREYALSKPGQYTVSATLTLRTERHHLIRSEPIAITVRDIPSDERALIEKHLPELHSAIGVRDMIWQRDRHSSDADLLPPEVDFWELRRRVKKVYEQLRPSGLKHTLKWTLAFADLKLASTPKQRQKAVAQILRVRGQYEPLEQELIDLTLFRYGLRYVGEQVLQRNPQKGWPWDWDREQLDYFRNHEKLMQGAKPLPAEPWRQPIL
jgi:hypothetical protein